MNIFSRNKEIQILERIQSKSRIERLIKFIIGCFLVAISYNTFITSNELVPGGVGGLAIILNHLFKINNSTVILISNSFLLIASLAFLGKEKTKATLLGSILFPLFVKLTEHINIWIQIDTSQVLLSTIFGGMLYGIGVGLIFKAGFTTGGTDIINQIICKYAKTSMGKSMLMSDGLIVISSGIFLGINNMMYSIIILYIISLMSDRVILGISDSKTFYIVTSQEKEVQKYIIEELKHGVTVLSAKGGFTQEKENVLMTILPTKEYYQLKEGIQKIDKSAFYVITDTYEVFGGE